MKTRFFILYIFLIITATAFSQTGGAKGRVVNTNGIPISNANVVLENTTKGTYTKTNGFFKLSGLKTGNKVLLISNVGYKSTKVEIYVIADETIEIPNITLITKTENLDKIILNSKEKNKYVAREPSSSLRLKTEIIKLSQNIQVISSELLQDQQVTNIMDGVIRNVSGVTMIEHWGHFARIHMRGFRLPAFRNGVNVQDSWGPLSEDMNNVERIEFIKGPAGFMMSAGEPGGFYNVVTKKPTEEFIGNVSFTGGSFDFYRGTLDFSGKLTKNGKLLGRFNAMYQTTDSHRGDEDVARYNFSPSFTYNLSDNTSITSEINYTNAESFIGSAYIFVPVTDGYGSLDRDFKFTDTNYPVTEIEEIIFFTTLNQKLGKNWGFESKFGYKRSDVEGNAVWGSITNTGDATRDIFLFQSLSIGKFFQAYIDGQFNTGGISHNVLGGFDYTEKKLWADFSQFHDTTEPFNIYNPKYGHTTAPNFDYSISARDKSNGVPYNGFTTRSFYTQDELGFLDNKIRLTLAGRYTKLITEGKLAQDEKFTPRVGLSVDVLPSFSVYAMYDQSFLGQNGTTFEGSPANPVDAIDIEGGIKKSFFDGRLKASLGVYQITKQNLTSTDMLHEDPDTPGNFPYVIQIGEVQSKGIEFDMQGEITLELNIVLNYANTNVEITENDDESVIGNRIAGHAKHVTNGWLNYNFSKNSKLKGFGASLGYQYQVDRSSWALGYLIINPIYQTILD